jgi:uncharacterized protein (DUF433 family)
MEIENYFDFQRPDDIRLKGTRIGIETILYDYIYKDRTAEEIAEMWASSLSLEQIHATILYYLHNKESVSKYIADWLEWGEQQRQEQELNPPPSIERIRELKAARTARKRSNAEAVPEVKFVSQYLNDSEILDR